MKLQSLFAVGLVCALLTACSNHINQEYLVEKYTNEHSKFIEVNGQNIHYRDEGQGEVVVLIHGTASSLHTWDAWTEILASQFRVIRMDLPGLGLTGANQGHRYEIPDDVAFMNGFLNRLNIKKAHIVGSSLGGRIAWEYSLNFPKKTKSITLINALGYPQESWPPAIGLAMLPGMNNIMPYLTNRFVFSQSLKDIYFDSKMITDSVIDRYYELSLYPGNGHAFPIRVKAKLDDQAQKIKHISVPTLILWGEEDEYFPVQSAHHFHQDIKHSQLITYDNIGHLPMEENPKQSSMDFIGFIQSLSTDQLTLND